ncbi:MAG: chromate resistance protein, partial [candidate division NC10 bacterium]|nr:chromate resistance protein [candidate division NC10 bacterium]
MDHARGGQHGPGGLPWLIKKFVDPQAEFLFVPKDQVLEVARREGGKSFDCPGADYTHREGKCS